MTSSPEFSRWLRALYELILVMGVFLVVGVFWLGLWAMAHFFAAG